MSWIAHKVVDALTMFWKGLQFGTKNKRLDYAWGDLDSDPVPDTMDPAFLHGPML